VPETPKHDITVIGAGIVGICCALELAASGRSVRVIDRDGPAEGTSSGNAGVISPWSCVPQSLPEQWKRIPRWTLSKEGPVALRWGYLPTLLPWLGRFLASAQVSRIGSIADAILALNHNCPGLYRTLLRDTGQESLIQDSSYIHVFRDKLQADPAQLQWVLRRERGVPLEFVSGDEVREIEPALSSDYQAAVLIPDQARTLNPARLGQVLAQRAQNQGVVFARAHVQELVPGEPGSFGVRTEQGMMMSKQVILASGAWSARLLHPLGVRIPLESERGYHTVFTSPGVTLNNSILDGDGKFAVSSMEMGLRCAGTAEFAGLDAQPDYRRAKVIAQWARRMLPKLNTGVVSEWMGSRPSTPDSLPCIGPVPGQAGLFAAFGHGHLGLTQAPMTGRLAAAMVCDKPSPINITPYRLDRF
jgi:D-amino-acid dehydrogenase|tara:strand:+ start:1884 stop:3134 length:1251 start_codon:yes stop_codon:yes gene_type:complete